MKKLILFALLITTFQLSAQQRLLEKDSLKEDLQLLYQAFDEVHPGTYRYLTPEELKSNFDQLYTNLPETISEGDFMIRLAQTVGKVKCGHTYVNPWNMDKGVRNRLFNKNIFFPIGFEIIDHRFYITENVSSHSSIKKGAEILSLNDIPMSTIYDSLRTVPKMDGNNDNALDPYFSISNYAVRDWEAFELYYSLFFPDEDGVVQLEFQNYGSDQVQKVALILLDKVDRYNKMKEAYGDLSKSRKEWKLSIINDELAALRIGTFAIWNWKDFNYSEWLDQAFTKLEEKGIQSLIVDIRGNGGGDGNAKDEVLSYLVKEKMERKNDTRSLIRTVKIKEALHPYCDTWLDVIINGLPQDYYAPYDEMHYLFAGGGSNVSIIPKEKAFKGQTYILGDGSNTSATYTLLLLAKTYGFAQFIGSESGGNLQGINGDQYVFFRLPYSKMEVDIPLVFTQPIAEMPDKGVMPDILVKKTQESISSGSDPFLDAVNNQKR